jgi:hypothetical protein
MSCVDSPARNEVYPSTSTGTQAAGMTASKPDGLSYRRHPTGADESSLGMARADGVAAMGVGSDGGLATLCTDAVEVAAEDVGCDAAGGRSVAVHPAIATTRPTTVNALKAVKRADWRGDVRALAGRLRSCDIVTSSWVRHLAQASLAATRRSQAGKRDINRDAGISDGGRHSVKR